MKTLHTLLLTCLFCSLTSYTFAAADAQIGINLPVSNRSTHTQNLTGDNAVQCTTPNFIFGAAVQENNGILSWTFTTTNRTDHELFIPHRSGQNYDVAIFDKKGQELYRWSKGMAFTQALTNIIIPAHGTLSYTGQIPKEEYQKFKRKAATIQMELTDTSYALSLKMITVHSTPSYTSPITLHGSISIGK